MLAAGTQKLLAAEVFIRTRVDALGVWFGQVCGIADRKGATDDSGAFDSHFCDVQSLRGRLTQGKHSVIDKVKSLRRAAERGNMVLKFAACAAGQLEPRVCVGNEQLVLPQDHHLVGEESS